METQNDLTQGQTPPWSRGVFSEKYPNPFCDIASMYMPVRLEDAFKWCEYLMLETPPFMAVANRVVSYFLTEIEIDEVSDDVRDDYKDFFDNKLHAIQALQDIGRDYFTYGNSFVSVNLPFQRFLRCPSCGTEYNVEKMRYDFDSESGAFMCECPKCRAGKTEFKRIDRRLRDPSKVSVQRWNPKRIKLKVNDISGYTRYYYEIPSRFVEKVREGDPFYINTVQWGFIETCLGKKGSGSDDLLFEFEDGQLYHMKDAVLAGLSDDIKGWSLPPILPYFKLAYYIQLMRRYDEAIALDFVVPFRIVFPAGQSPGGQDPLSLMSMQTFTSWVAELVEKKRRDLTSMAVAPFQVGYEMIGGEAKQLAPKDSIQQALQELLNAMGFPQELFAGTLSLQAAPVALRLFEKEWNPFVDGINTILQWITNQVARYFSWDQAKVRLAPVTLADDMEKRQVMLQAAAGQDISKQTAYRTFGYDYLAEQRRIVQEQKDIQKMQEEAIADAQAQAASGAMGGGGPGGDESGMNGPGGQVGATPGDIESQASQLAENLVKANNPAQTRHQLAQIKQTNPTLYAMVKAKMQDLRQELSYQGQQMAIQQM